MKKQVFCYFFSGNPRETEIHGVWNRSSSQLQCQYSNSKSITLKIAFPLNNGSVVFHNLEHFHQISHFTYATAVSNLPQCISRPVRVPLEGDRNGMFLCMSSFRSSFFFLKELLFVPWITTVSFLME